MDHLTEAQLQDLQASKVKLRVNNEKYLRAHPELALLIRTFVKSVLVHEPESIAVFAHDFFTRNEKDIQKEMDNVNVI